MADSSTERARRARAHAKNDHSLCRPQRCPVVQAHLRDEHSQCSAEHCEAARRALDSAAPAGGTPAPPPPVDVDERAFDVRSSALRDGDEHEFGPAGRLLWEAVNPGDELGALQVALLREACRTADRLRALDAQLNGDGPWLELLTENGRTFVVVVTEPLREARQQAMALKALVAELRQANVGGRNSSRPPAPDGPGKGEGASIVDLSAAIKAKLAAAAAD